MDIDGKNEWKPCLSVEGIRLPTSYYFGASAATGDLAGIVYSLSVIPFILTFLICSDCGKILD